MNKLKKVGRETLKRWWTESAFYLTIRNGDKILFSNELLWGRLFDTEILRLVIATGEWKGVPQVTFLFQIDGNTSFDCAEITFKRNGKTWYRHVTQLEAPYAIPQRTGTLRFIVSLKERWNGL